MNQVREVQVDGTESINQKLQIYLAFQDNSTYKQKGPKIKDSILKLCNKTLLQTINCLKTILTYRHLTSCKDILEVQATNYRQNGRLFFSQIQLSQYSMLLALRFIRDIYFQSFYPFILLASIEFTEIFRKIATFKSELKDQQRGKYLFVESESQVFKCINNVKSKHSNAQLQRIGFSLYKMVMQIIKKSATVYKLIPFHQQFCLRNQQFLKPFFANNICELYKRLVNENVKFPQNYYYFKKNEHIDFITKYKTIDGASSVKLFYHYIFRQTWQSINSSIDHQSSNYVFNVLENDQSIHTSYITQIMKKIGSKTNDRYFWGYLDSFIKQKFYVLQDQEQNTEKQKNIVRYFWLLGFLVYQLRNFQILAYIEQQHIQKMYKHFIFFLNSFNQIYQTQHRKGHNLQNSQKEVKIMNMGISIVKATQMIWLVLINLKHQFKEANLLQFLSKYLHPISCIKTRLQIPILDEKMVYHLNNYTSQEIKKQITKKELLSKYFYPKVLKVGQQDLKNHLNTEIKQMFDSKLSFFYFDQSLDYQKQKLQSEVKFTTELQIMDEIKQLEQINLSVIELSQSQIKSAFSHHKSVEKTFLCRTSYKVAKNNAQNCSSQKSIAASADSKRLSFKDSLKQNIQRVSYDSIKSLSIRKIKVSNSNYTPSLINIEGPLQSLIIVEDIDNNDELSLEEGLKIDKRMVDSIKQTIETRVMKLRKPKIANTINEAKQDRKIERVLNSKQQTQNYQYKASNDNNPTQREIKKQKVMIKGHNNLNSALFVFSVKTKRDLLKNKCLLKKTHNIELGMSTTFQEEPIISKSGMSRHYITLSLYLTALIQIKNVRVKVQFPPWITVLESRGSFLKKLIPQSQHTIYFKLLPNFKKQSLHHYNFGKLPTLNLRFDYLDQTYAEYFDLPFLISKFALQHQTSKSQFQNILEEIMFLPLITVHNRIASDLKQLKKLFPVTTVVDRSQQHIPIKVGNVGVLKFEYLVNKQYFFLVFQQRRDIDSNYKSQLCLDIVFHEQKKWDFLQSEVIKTCFKSIFAA